MHVSQADRTTAHMPALLGALPACLHTIRHLPHPFTAIGTGFTNIRTQRADPANMQRLAQHEIGRRLAQLGTIEHQSKMGGLYMLAA